MMIMKAILTESTTEGVFSKENELIQTFGFYAFDPTRSILRRRVSFTWPLQ